VDPLNGNDATATGSGFAISDGGATSSAGCKFKTVTRALAFIGRTAPAKTEVAIDGAALSSDEVYPIVVPANVLVTGTSSAVTVTVPSGKIGFALSGAGASLSNLTIDGADHQAVTGVWVGRNTDDTTMLTNITVQSFGRDGIGVGANGTVTIGQGVSSTGNGTSAARHSGLAVVGKATVSVPSGSAKTSFDGNTDHGIVVGGGGHIIVTGVAGTSGDGTVTVNSNYFAGLYIAQTPGSSSPQNVITGLVSWGSTNGNGVHLFTGSNVKLRSSYVLDNAGNGVAIGVARGSTDVSSIDLGTSSDFGHNTLQAAESYNLAAGICLNVPGVTLAAAGNVFRGIDCSQATPSGALTRLDGCRNGVDLGIGGKGSNITTANCTHP
jgi:hypothetical protein